MYGPILNTHRPAYLPDPVNRQHPLNHGRAFWWLTLPGLDGGRQAFDAVAYNHGTLVGMGNANNGWRGTTRPGGSGHLLCDGTGGYVSLGPWGVGAGPYTIAAWVRPTSVAGTQSLVRQDTGTPRKIYGIRLTAGKFTSLQYDNVTIFEVSSLTSPVAGNWYRVAITRTGNSHSIAVNGAVEATATGSSASLESTGQIAGFAHDPNGGIAEMFAGAIDDVGVWGRSLSAAEIFADYELSRRSYPGVLNRARSRVAIFSVPSVVGFSYSPSGGIALGGSALPPAVAFAPAPSGGLILGGSALPPFLTFGPVPSGGLILGGSALPPSVTMSGSASGGMVLGGSASPSPTFTATASGGLILGGSAVPAPSFAPSPSGGAVIGGTATRTVAFAASPAGGVSLGGSAIAAFTPTFSVTPSGGLVVGGAAVVTSNNSFTYSPSGGLSLGGSAFTVYHATQTPYRDRDVYLAIKALLKAATHDGKSAFDRVTLGKPGYAQRIKSDDASWVDIQPLSDGTTTAGSPSREFHRPSYVLTIGVRDTDDPELTYVSRLDRLTALVRNTLLSPGNRTFGGLVISGYTKLSDGSIGASGYPGMTRTLHGEFAYEVSLASSGYSTVF